MAVTKLGRGQRADKKLSKSMNIAVHPAVGMWADRQDMKDVRGWLEKIRAPRYDRLGRRRAKP